MYPIAGVSALLTIVSFVLVMLTIFAGNKPGYMEDYHILYFNTSTLGENLVPKLKARAPMPEPTAPPTLLNRFHEAPEKRIDIGGGLNDIGNGINSVANQAGSAVGNVATAAGAAATEAVGKGLDALSDIQNNLADELAKKLGIKEFYSIHLVDLCQGDFTPKATDPEATFDVSNCTEPFNYNLLNISALLDKQLSVGPFSLNLADLGLTNDIQDKLDDVPKIIQAIVAMYIIAAIFIALSLFASIGAIALIPNSAGSKIVMGNLGLAGVALFFLLVGNLITTIGSGKVVEKVTELGDGIGLSAVRGGKFIALSWAAFALMLLVVFYWIYEFFAEKQRGSDAHNRAIGGFSFGHGKSEAGWSETDSGLASRENSFPREQQGGMAGGYPPTHAPSGMGQQPVSPMDEVPLDGYNYGRGTHEPQPVSPLDQGGYGQHPPARY
ncbi:sur7 protein [Diaporthe amygdali]|uniref:sur7 protein n=1 Tax=Phomopsis amygdali TaxID=1214568 RepID=UPI0022FEE620|nr:sur7 protein [Diaporthe amygdali]KAJ0117293.1 sur7 protein [Diaporthe amygdali]